MKLTLQRSCKSIEIDSKKITGIDEGEDKDIHRDRVYPWSDVHLYNEEDDSATTIRVVESKKHIIRKIKEENEP